jgi:hypothetical protein
LAKENSLIIVFIPGGPRDSYLDTKKPQTSKTVKNKFSWVGKMAGTALDDCAALAKIPG